MISIHVWHEVVGQLSICARITISSILYCVFHSLSGNNWYKCLYQEDGGGRVRGGRGRDHCGNRGQLQCCIRKLPGYLLLFKYWVYPHPEEESPVLSECYSRHHWYSAKSKTNHATAGKAESVLPHTGLTDLCLKLEQTAWFGHAKLIGVPPLLRAMLTILCTICEEVCIWDST